LERVLSEPNDTQPIYRIGAVANLTGIPVPTLRVWEQRYRAFNPKKTEGKQRLYNEHDVAKAHVLKQLTGAGHTISAVAHLSLPELRGLNSSLHASHRPTKPCLHIAVIGTVLANRIESKKFRSALQQQCLKVLAVADTLNQAINMVWPQAAEVLIIKVASLQNTVFETIQTLLKQRRFAHTVVLYNFAPDMLVQAMRASGMTVRRDPISDLELAELLQSALMLQPLLSSEGVTIHSGGRKFSEEVLKRVANIPTNVLCECPKHVAELITQLADFETYSQDCLSRNQEDANLHAYLKIISGSARALFENALEKIADHEGIDLSEANQR
jgi:MerR family transcriptional regulator, light-induced transcriptional regulator